MRQLNVPQKNAEGALKKKMLVLKGSIERYLRMCTLEPDCLGSNPCFITYSYVL